MKELKSIPKFKNEDEEAEFWAVHDSTEYIDWNKAIVNPVFPKLKSSTKTRTTIINKSISKTILEYTAIFEPAEEGGYIVRVPALPGCVTQGDTFEEAVFMIKDAIKGYIKVLNKEGKPIPEEKSEVVITKISINNPVIAL